MTDANYRVQEYSICRNKNRNDRKNGQRNHLDVLFYANEGIEFLKPTFTIRLRYYPMYN